MCAAPDLTALRDQIRRLEQPARHALLPFGAGAIDAALPGGGLALGAVHEIVGAGRDEEDGAAAAGFAAGILARLGRQAATPGGPRERGPREQGVRGEGPVLWCLKKPDLYGPGLATHGLDPGRLVLVRGRRDEEVLWAVEEALRTPGLAAVVGEIGRLPMTAGRRLQLAAERSGVTALVLRRWRNAAEAADERGRPTAAVTRWRIAVLASAAAAAGPGLGVGRPRWRVELVRVRGGAPGSWEVEAADATGHVRVPAGLAVRPAAASGQKAGEETGPRLRRAG